MKISTNKFVSLSYDLNVGEEDETQLMERATSENPLEFIYGTGSMLEAFEKNIDGLKEGDDFSFQLTPLESYGEYSDDHVVELPKDMFLQDGVLNEEVVFAGNMIPMMDADGNRLNGLVLEVEDTIVKMDFNHPLAGDTLNFSGKVLAVREATAEELTALFAPQGGCGSGCDCGSGGGCAPQEETAGEGCGCGSGGGGCGCH